MAEPKLEVKWRLKPHRLYANDRHLQWALENVPKLFDTRSAACLGADKVCKERGCMSVPIDVVQLLTCTVDGMTFVVSEELLDTGEYDVH